ncbi:hypothetical protein O181_048235 [Austropuccinia psidii MF-1]|uniref:CRAL-TRIO domain-containing protein n=1 Tax=Austropuccinia psidii MF-1 TaxID=1389203 RepID=A0A9Q3DWV2_9BASI|nr:hypothetical protein [Austropuccinia psidii MF-1]
MIGWGDDVIWIEKNQNLKNGQESHRSTVVFFPPCTSSVSQSFNIYSIKLVTPSTDRTLHSMTTKSADLSATSSLNQVHSSSSKNSRLNPQGLNDHEIEILNEFKLELHQEGHSIENTTLGSDDQTLIRFLKARKFNLDSAKKMIKQCLQWRHQFEGIGIDGLYKELDPFDFPHRDQVFKFWPIYYHRTDKLGRPINIQNLGDLDLNKLYSVIDKQTHFKVVVANCEALTREILPACNHLKQSRHPLSPSGNSHSASNSVKGSPPNNVNDNVTNAFCIIDLKGFTLSQFWQIKSVAQSCFRISQDYYPETMGYLAIINAPKSFATIFKAIQPWLSKDTISKINILGDDYQSTLLKYIDAENLPSFLGGKCQCDEDRPWSCAKNDEKFDQSPWLKERDWKNESWKKFKSPFDSNGLSKDMSTATVASQDKDNYQTDNDEITDGGLTQDGVLIINSAKKAKPANRSSPTSPLNHA